jgi:hypothetical protein
MKFKLLAILFCFATVMTLKAQWSGTNPIYTVNSNVGIGTNAPSQKLQIKGGSLLVGSGASPNVNSGIRITAPINSTNYNWLIAASNNITNGFEITPSTATGGTTFSTPVISLLYGGNVGIGINSPAYKLDVAGSINISTGSTFNINGSPHTHSIYPTKTGGEAISGDWTFSGNQIINSGIKIHFGGYNTSNITFSTSTHKFMFQIDDYSADNIFQFQGKDAAGTTKTLALFKPRAGVELYHNGDKKIETKSYGVYIPEKLSIGKDTSSSYKLDVWGKIRAHEVVVSTIGADFVFDNDYNLLSLIEVDQFIKEHKHLPDIPSASVMKGNGMSLGEMQTKLLQKIEELTIYTIELSKKSEMQSREIENLNKKIEGIENLKKK